MHLHHISLFFILFSLSIFTVQVLCSNDEVRSLLEFKKGIKEDPFGKVVNSWTISSSASTESCPSSWTGIECDESGSVSAIVLNRLGLGGDLKLSTLIGLKMLKNLSLSGNSFTGRLVPSLGSMSTLQYLDLSENLFCGPIPARINELWGLSYLNLSVNNFAGGFPTGIRNLQQLKTLDLHKNGLRGDIGDLLSELRNIEHVDLSYNLFYGSLPVDSSNVSSLANTVHHLNLSHNRVSGGFFSNDSLALFRNLVVLDLGDNQISGELPQFPELPQLQILNLGNNQLFGQIPGELFSSSVPLVVLDLSGNGFSGSIEEMDYTTLTFLNFSSNLIRGALPPSLGRCQVVDLSNNMISGDLSILQSWEPNLEVLDLSSNRLSGSFPNLTSQFQRLTTLKLQNNSLVGNLPPVVGAYPVLTTVDFSLNKLDGHIPPSLFTSLTLINLNLSGNQFTGEIPLQHKYVSEMLILPTFPQMESLDLSSNSLTGNLSSDIGHMVKLRLLNLAKNDLSGNIPKELSNLSSLEYLDLSKNNFYGAIPDKLPLSLKSLNLSYNNLSGHIPENLFNHFPPESFHPGNANLYSGSGPLPPSGFPSGNGHGEKRHSSKSNIKTAIIVASVGAAVMIAFVLVVYYRAQHDFHGRNGIGGTTAGRDIRLGRFSRPSLFKFHTSTEPPATSLSFSNDHLLTSNSRSLSGQTEFVTEIVEPVSAVAASSATTDTNIPDKALAASGRKSSSGSPIASSPRFIEACEQPVTLDVYSPDRLAGELFFLDDSLAFTAEQLSRAPAEVLGRSSHGTLYKATLDNGHMLTVKWLRVGLVKHKKEFAKEVKRIGSMRHPNIVPLRAYYWGPREQERLVLADYIEGDSLALHLYETTPRRHSPLSFNQRLKVAVDIARCLAYLHDRGLPHGNLKPTNVLLEGPEYTGRLTDYGLHRLMTPTGIAEQILNLGALGYCSPELASAAKPIPSFKADVYAFGVILMELLTRRSAGDIISGQSGAVDLTDWVRLCDQEGRGMDCIDRDIAGGEEPTKAMNDLLAISLRCILPVNERPNVRQIFEDLSSISV
ncbi:Leucine rich repeat 4 [Dillenia turbinata]|uniref:Leucine rich repeat 4 n=1 Tax=Dillenia turbinata TaxID=194707 RepID=A0AAN8V097_9MAGN